MISRYLAVQLYENFDEPDHNPGFIKEVEVFQARQMQKDPRDLEVKFE